MKILFVCTGNTCRSPIAEGLFNKYAAEHNINASGMSAGIAVTQGSVVSEYSVETTKKFDVDISGHIPTQITGEILDKSDIIITMSASHKEYLKFYFSEYSQKIFSISEYAGGSDIPDPYGGDLQVYNLCADKINNSIIKLIERIKSNE